MEKENFNELSTEDLIKKKKTTSFVTGILAGMLTVLLIMSIFLAIKQGLIGFSLIAVVFGLLPILFINYNQVRSINKELKNRNLN